MGAGEEEGGRGLGGGEPGEGRLAGQESLLSQLRLAGTSPARTAEPASPAATTGPTPSAKLSSDLASEVDSQQRVSPPTTDSSSTTSRRSFQTILSKN